MHNSSDLPIVGGMFGLGRVSNRRRNNHIRKFQRSGHSKQPNLTRKTALGRRLKLLAKILYEL